VPLLRQHPFRCGSVRLGGCRLGSEVGLPGSQLRQLRLALGELAAQFIGQPVIRPGLTGAPRAEEPADEPASDRPNGQPDQ
jgi:hypothetical protein